jgi:hypothetical protein
MRAVAVTPTLDWRLHGFDLLCEHAPPPGTPDWPLMGAAWMVGAQYKPAEVPLSSLFTYSSFLKCTEEFLLLCVETSVSVCGNQ